ncbi:AraC-like protein [Brevibacterium sanguinis]|uniref:AraC-like protein n=2 Tax=Brevibacterium TaxID=1696 RepID=A0A366IQK6_9MICO|nr:MULTISPECIES: helix-turn-helix domain-containing protein [Brevibacterium]RBP67801.1 AraC-like protein [Brevibacterium sanguinis]RBP74782.1 AraC-like protein [Brevibacterium celere]
MFEFATEDIGAWEHVARRVAAVRCDPLGNIFSGGLKTRTLTDDVSVSFIRTSPLRISHIGNRNQSPMSDRLLLSMQAAGSATVIQHGRSIRISSDMAALNETRSNFAVEPSSGEQRLLVLSVPRDRVTFSDREIADVCASPLDRRTPSFNALSGFLSGLFRDGVAASPTEQIGLAEAAVLLLSAILSSTTGSAPSDTSLLHVLLQYVHRHLGDPALSVATMAEANFVSVRQVHRVFAGYGVPPAVYIRRLRLSRASNMLLRRQYTNMTIAGIADACGYSDPVVFSRAFAREYGVPPSQWNCERKSC